MKTLSIGGEKVRVQISVTRPPIKYKAYIVALGRWGLGVGGGVTASSGSRQARRSRCGGLCGAHAAQQSPNAIEPGRQWRHHEQRGPGDVEQAK